MTITLKQSLNAAFFLKIKKIEKVIPIHKKNDPSLLESYGTISILTSISKILEKNMCNKINDYFNLNIFFYCGQYGFRNQHYTELAAI